jgi:hypothetical protein
VTAPEESKLQARIEELEARLDTKIRSGEHWKELYEQERAARARAELERQEAVDSKDSYIKLTAEHRLAHGELVEARDAAIAREEQTNATNWSLIAHVGTLQQALDAIANPPDPSTNSDLSLLAVRALEAMAKNA